MRTAKTDRTGYNSEPSLGAWAILLVCHAVVHFLLDLHQTFR